MIHELTPSCFCFSVDKPHTFGLDCCSLKWPAHVVTNSGLSLKQYKEGNGTQRTHSYCFKGPHITQMEPDTLSGILAQWHTCHYKEKIFWSTSLIPRVYHIINRSIALACSSNCKANDNFKFLHIIKHITLHLDKILFLIIKNVLLLTLKHITSLFGGGKEGGST